MMSYIKFRYTLDPDDSQSKFKIRQLFGMYTDILKPVHMVVGFETKNNLGEETHPHIHVHFTTMNKVESIRKALTRMWKEDGETRTRAALYSLKEEKDVVDVDRFWRYPLKQKDTYMSKLHKLPEGFNLELNTILAHEQWNSVVEVNRKKQETLLSKESTYSKLETFLDEKDLKSSSVNAVQKAVLEYYKKERLSMNIKTMSGYALTYCCLNDLISDDVILKRMNEMLLS